MTQRQSKSTDQVSRDLKRTDLILAVQIIIMPRDYVDPCGLIIFMFGKRNNHLVDLVSYHTYSLIHATYCTGDESFYYNHTITSPPIEH